MMFANGIVQIEGLRYVLNGQFMTKKSNIHDFYFYKAKQENFSARSVYKLQNIQDKYHLISSGNKVLDLGAAPGSWTEYLLTLLGKNGQLWALDQQPLSLTALEKI